MINRTSLIKFYSKPAAVSMGDDYYELATLDHFWIKHRFKALNFLFHDLIRKKENGRVADIGSGHGVLQVQLEKEYSLKVDGFDLNRAALENSIAANHLIAYYDINDRLPELKHAYDSIFLFDVIEHLAEVSCFLESVKYHLKPNGVLFVNVPAGNWLFSKYDSAAGHYRRYSMSSLNSTLQCQGFTVLASSYWGLAYIPLILFRKLALSLRPHVSDSDIINTGFKPPSLILNRLLNYLSRFDPLPNYFAGSSLIGAYTLNSDHV